MELRNPTQPVAAVPAIPAATPVNGAVPAPAAIQASPDQAVLKQLGLGQLRPSPHQPRRSFPEEELRALGQDLLARGQLVPLIVNPGQEPDLYTIFDGHRRCEAGKLVGLDTLLCMVVPADMAAAQRFEAQLITTLQRTDLKPSERAQAFRVLLDNKQCTARKLAADLHVSESLISSAQNILDLDPQLWPAVDRGELTQTHVRQLTRIKDPQRQRAKAEAILARKQQGKARSKAESSAALTCQVGPVQITCRAEGLTVEQADAALTELSRDLKKFRGRDLHVVRRFFATKAIAEEATAAVQELSRPGS